MIRDKTGQNLRSPEEIVAAFEQFYQDLYSQNASADQVPIVQEFLERIQMSETIGQTEGTDHHGGG